MYFKTKFKENKGITLIALVVTIIVLLILAGISINALAGQNGILNRTTSAKQKTEEAQVQEELETGLMGLFMDYQVEAGGLGTFADYIFANEAKVQSELGGNVGIDTTNKTITYKGTLFSVADDGKVTRKDGIGISGDKSTLSIVGDQKETATLTATLTNISGTVTWTSTNTGVATVTGNGTTATVNAVAAGTTTIKAKCGEKEASYEITVKQINLAKSLEITGDKTEVAAGGKITLTLTQKNDTNNANETIEWTSSSSNATVTGDDTRAEVTGVSKADSVTITATAKNSNVFATYTIKVKDNTWSKLSKAAKIIAESSEDYSAVGKAEVEIEDGGQKIPVTIEIGQTYDIEISNKNYTVRVIDFKHDDLATGESYGSGSTATKAGISFEFVTRLGTSKMMETSTNKGGWGASTIRTNLNSKGLAQDGSINLKSIEDVIGSNLIKKVKKKYIDQKETTYTTTGDNASEVKESEDYLWLLSCSEVWSDGYTTGAFGYTGTSEGSQYKYYALNQYDASGNLIKYSSNNPNFVKRDTSNSAVWWWLRSPYYSYSYGFSDVSSNGNAASYYATHTGGSVAPGFAI